MWPWTLMDDLKKTIGHYVKLCASFQIIFKLELQSEKWKRSIQVKIGDFLSRVTLQFVRWPWKTIGHLFYTTSSFVHHFKSIGEFKFELLSGNVQLGLKSAIFFVPCDLEIWWMTFKAEVLPVYIRCTTLQLTMTVFHNEDWVLIVLVLITQYYRLGLSHTNFRLADESVAIIAAVVLEVVVLVTIIARSLAFLVSGERQRAFLCLFQPGVAAQNYPLLILTPG